MHNLDMTNDRANIAFLGSRKDVWHQMGQEMLPNMNVAQWAAAAGLEWEAIKVPAIASLEGPQFDHIAPANRFRKVDGKRHIVRSDNGYPLGYVSDRYQVVQPREVLEWFEQYIGVDDRFQLDVAGSLKCGEIIWATATYKDPLEVAGDRHVARLLMTTTFDGSGSTINKGVMTRVVCNNTLDVALVEKGAAIKTRHSTKFDAEAVSKELAAVAQGFATYKKMGDAMVQNHMAKEEISNFFKACLDIPFDAKKEDVSTRKLNQFDALNQAYITTAHEGAAGNAWAALNAITRYVDHDRSVQKGDVGVDVARFNSAQFGSGANLKAKAMDLLLPRIKDKVLIAA